MRSKLHQAYEEHDQIWEEHGAVMEESGTLWTLWTNKIMQKPLERCVRRLAHREKGIEVENHCICSCRGGQALQQQYFKERGGRCRVHRQTAAKSFVFNVSWGLRGQLGMTFAQKFLLGLQHRAESCRGSESSRAGEGRLPECRMAAETAHKAPGCPLGARDSGPAALPERRVMYAILGRKPRQPNAASPCCSAHTHRTQYPWLWISLL